MTIFWKKFISAALLLGLLSCGMAGCGKSAEQESGDIVEKPVLLTNVYKSQDLDKMIDDDTSLGDYIGVQEGMLVFSGYYSHTEGEYGDPDFSTENYAVLYKEPIDGGEPVIERLQDVESISAAALSADSMVYAANRYMEDYRERYTDLHIRKTDGTQKTVEDIASLLPPNDDPYGGLYIEQMAIDAEGYIYLLTGSAIAVFTPELIFSSLITTDTWIQKLCLGNDGIVYAAYDDYRNDIRVQSLAPVDKTARVLGAPVPLPENTADATFFFGPEYDLYYYNETGIYGCQKTEEGMGEGEMLLNFQNSSITSDLDGIWALSGKRFLLHYYDRLTWDRQIGIFSPAPDIDLRKIKVLEIASFGGDSTLSSRVARFNRAHSDVRLTYTVFDGSNDTADASAVKLLNDLTSGAYKADILATNTSTSVYSSLLKNDRLLDLYPFLDKDDTLKRDAFFGYILRTFTKNEQLVSLPTSAILTTIYANKSLLGDRTHWTLSEMMDFIEKLPDGVAFMQNMCQSLAQGILGETGLGSFVDTENGVCHFDSPAFLQYLRYLKSLPVEPQKQGNDGDNRYIAYQSGKVAAQVRYYSDISNLVEEMAYFPTDGGVHIGYPAEEGKSGTVMTSYAGTYGILKGCEYPDEAWSFIRELYLNENSMNYQDGIPVTRMQWERQREELLSYTYEIYFDGGMGWGTDDGSGGSFTEDANVSMRSDSMAVRLTEADLDEIAAWLDSVGAPLVTALPQEINSIITEELSSYLSNSKSAEDAAAMIQNRVSLYLAENN